MSEAARMFFETPELVEKLLPFLDLKSTLHLARTHVLTQNILAGSRIWNKLIRRTHLQDGGDLGLDHYLGLGLDLDEKMDVVRHLVAILKLMKDPKANMRDLLETICKRLAQIMEMSKEEWAAQFEELED